MDITLEICCGTLYDVQMAAKAGADRIELNSAFYLGGLTPTVGTLRLAKKICDLPMIAMVRPRGGGFSGGGFGGGRGGGFSGGRGGGFGGGGRGGGFGR